MLINATPEEMADVRAMEEDVPLVVDGVLTEAGQLCLLDIRNHQFGTALEED